MDNKYSVIQSDTQTLIQYLTCNFMLFVSVIYQEDIPNRCYLFCKQNTCLAEFLLFLKKWSDRVQNMQQKMIHHYLINIWKQKQTRPISKQEPDQHKKVRKSPLPYRTPWIEAHLFTQTLKNWALKPQSRYFWRKFIPLYMNWSWKT